jgi:hypothetical protein
MSSGAPDTAKPQSTFACDCEDWMRSACAGDTFHKEHHGSQYCVLHYPGKDKSADFQKALQRKLASKDFDFRGVWFPDELRFSKFDFSADADFRGATFNATANFIAATFSAKVDFFKAAFRAEASFTNAVFTSPVDFYDVIFGAEADFRAVTFSSSAEFRRVNFGAAANFRYATFKDHANFHSATFSSSADFSRVTFKAAVDFSAATFSAAADLSAATFSGQADFLNCTFNARTNFRDAVFGDYVKFAGDTKARTRPGTWSLDLQFARMEKPDHVSFHTLALCPHWFVNVDARKFEFVTVEWRYKIKPELRELTNGGYGPCAPAEELLAVTCQRLAVNAEENQRYEDASKFRYMAMDARRREKYPWFAPWRLSWWYWLASGYGERVFRALVAVVGIWLVFASLYNHVGFARWEPRLASESDVVTAKRDDVGAPLKFSRAMTYSAGVMTLQKPEPRPATAIAQTVVLVETILGPVQAALLALAIRRKFMR